MERVTIKSIRLENFKGAKALEVDFNEHGVTTISGPNACGKTTVFDAFTWALFGKDSAGRTDSGRGSFSVKTLQPDGTPIAQIDHSVEVTLTAKGRATTLRRQLKENWVKQRGKVETELKGNVTHYFIDGVEVKASRYAEEVDSIMPEGTLKLLTDPAYFPNLDWQSRRDILTQIAGDVTVEEAARGHENFEKILERLAGRRLADYKMQLAYEKKTAKAELDEIPVKVAAIQSVMPATVEVPKDAAEMKAAAQAEIKSIEGRQADFAKAAKGKYEDLMKLRGRLNDTAARREALVAADREAADRKAKKANEAREAAMDNLGKARRQKAAAEEALKTDLEHADSVLSTQGETVRMYRKQRQDLLDEFERVRTNALAAYDTQYAEGSYRCPLLGKLCTDPEVMEAARKDRTEKLKQASDRLREIKDSGLKVKAKIEEAEKELESKTEERRRREEEGRREIDAMGEMIADIENQIAGMSEAKPVYTPDKEIPGVKEADEEMARIRGEIEKREAEAHGESGSKAAEELMQRRSKLQDEIDEITRLETEAEAARREAAAHQEEIDKLHAREKELSTRLAELESLEYDADQLERTRMTEIERRVNALFTRVRFRMFESQLNGGEVPTCTMTVDGVPYSDLNTAMQINAGLDVINALSSYYQVQAPIWIDHAESVTDLYPTGSQLIRLAVSEEKGLTIHNDQQ